MKKMFDIDETMLYIREFYSKDLAICKKQNLQHSWAEQ